MALAIVLALRLIFPLAILRWPLAGTLFAITLDFFDLHIFEALDWSELPAGDYQVLDKLLDLYHLALESIVVWHWKEDIFRRAGLALYLWKIGGTFVFFMTGLRAVMFFAPNIFEIYFICVLALPKLFPRLRLNSPKAVGALVLAITPFKLLHEYILHVAESSTTEFVKGFF